MSPAEVKALRYVVEEACTLFAATMGNKPIYDNRDHMAAFIRDAVINRAVLFDQSDYLAEVIVAANQKAAQHHGSEPAPSEES